MEEEGSGFVLSRSVLIKQFHPQTLNTPLPKGKTIQKTICTPPCPTGLVALSLCVFPAQTQIQRRVGGTVHRGHWYGAQVEYWAQSQDRLRGKGRLESGGTPGWFRVREFQQVLGPIRAKVGQACWEPGNTGSPVLPRAHYETGNLHTCPSFPP